MHFDFGLQQIIISLSFSISSVGRLTGSNFGIKCQVSVEKRWAEMSRDRDFPGVIIDIVCISNTDR
jgi:hypothetical protein